MDSDGDWITNLEHGIFQTLFISRHPGRSHHTSLAGTSRGTVNQLLLTEGDQLSSLPHPCSLWSTELGPTTPSKDSGATLSWCGNGMYPSLFCSNSSCVHGHHCCEHPPSPCSGATERTS